MTNLDILVYNQMMSMYSENENEYMSNISYDTFKEEETEKA